MNPDWLLRTTDCRLDGIFSELYKAKDIFMVTLEHAYPNQASWAPKIPRGATYTCRRGLHSLDHYNQGMPFETFEILGIPGHTGLLFHPGNWNKDSNGCVLTGRYIRHDAAGWWVTQSVAAYSSFMADLMGQDEFQLRVE